MHEDEERGGATVAMLQELHDLVGSTCKGVGSKSILEPLGNSCVVLDNSVYAFKSLAEAITLRPDRANSTDRDRRYLG